MARTKAFVNLFYLFDFFDVLKSFMPPVTKWMEMAGQKIPGEREWAHFNLVGLGNFPIA